MESKNLNDNLEQLNDNELDKVVGGANPALIMKGIEVGLEIVKPIVQDPKGRDRVNVPDVSKYKIGGSVNDGISKYK